MAADPKKTPSGKWRVQWIDSRGHRRNATYPTLTIAKAAQAIKAAEVAKVKAGLAQIGSDLTLAEAAVGWLARRAPAPGSAPDVMRRRGRRHTDNARHLEQHILPALGHLRLPEINDEAIEGFIRKLESTPTRRHGEVNAKADEQGNAVVQRTLKPGTISTVIITLRKMLNDLKVRIRISYKVPTSDYGWIKREADVGRFLEACSPPWFKMGCELAVYAGLRWGEVCALRWERVDFDRGLIMLDRSHNGTTKGKKVRAVPLAPELAASLKRWRLGTGAASGGLVVTAPPIEREDREPKPVNLSELTDLAKRVRRACKRAGVEPVTYHQLRHTFASHLAQRVAPAIVGAVLGHEDPKTTARYVHLDTAALARDPRLHLTFGAPAGKVVSLAVSNDLPASNPATADTAEKSK